jgi:hypothetical protein
MDASHVATSGTTLTATFEKLLLSGMRLSSAAALFGVAQLENAVTGWQDGEGLGGQIDRFGSTVNSLTQCLVDEISPGKKDALDSIAGITTKLVDQSMEAARMLDPMQLFRAATGLAQKSVGAVTGWTGRSHTSQAGEPRLAADVLAS